MKYLLIFILFAFSLQSHAQNAQTDSTSLYVKNVPMQAGDAKMFMRLFRSNPDLYEDCLQVCRSKITKTTTNSTVITLDSVRVDVLYGLYMYTQQVSNGLATGWANRISTMLKTTIPADPVVLFLRKLIQAVDDSFAAQLSSDKAYGDRVVLKQIN